MALPIWQTSLRSPKDHKPPIASLRPQGRYGNGIISFTADELGREMVRGRSNIISEESWDRKSAAGYESKMKTGQRSIKNHLYTY